MAVRSASARANSPVASVSKRILDFYDICVKYVAALLKSLELPRELSKTNEKPYQGTCQAPSACHGLVCAARVWVAIQTPLGPVKPALNVIFKLTVN